MQPEIECVIVNDYYNFLNICKKYTKSADWSKELWHFIILELYEKENINVELEYEQIKAYIIRMITINWCSKKSPFYTKYKKFSMNTIELSNAYEVLVEEYNEEDDKLLQLLEEEYGDLDWFDKLQFQTYLLTGTLKQTAEHQDTTTSKVWHNLQSTKKQIKNNILEKLNN